MKKYICCNFKDSQLKDITNWIDLDYWAGIEAHPLIYMLSVHEKDGVYYIEKYSSKNIKIVKLYEKV